jgi:hypothetical protein
MNHCRTLLVALVALMLVGCATVQEIIALRSVDFQLDRVTEVRLAGIDLSRVRSSSDLSFSDGARVAAALASRELPLSFRLNVLAANPASNRVTARLVRLRWTLFLENEETISGQLAHEYELPPGEPTTVPIDVSLDLLAFYERSGQDLIDLAMNLAGAGGAPKQVAIRAVPTIDTALGAISYPRPITIVSGSVGREELARRVE